LEDSPTVALVAHPSFLAYLAPSG